jgi:hypothetical protein
MINKLPNSNNYNTFAYDINLLRDFVRDDEGRDTGASRSARLSGRRMLTTQRRMSGGGGSLRGSFRGSIFNLRNRSGSIHSQGSRRGRESTNNTQ